MQRSVLVLALGVLLVGCGSAEPSAAPSTLPPVSAVPPPTRAVTAPPRVTSTLAAPGGDATEENATAFGRYWVEVLNDAYQRVDPANISRISAPACTACQNYILSLTAAQREGKHYRGGEITVRDAVAPAVEENETVVSVLVFVAALDELDRDGRVLQSLPALRTTLSVTLRRVNNRWWITEVTRS